MVEAEQCGWLKDKFGVSWQIVPTAMGKMLASGNKEKVARITGLSGFSNVAENHR